MAEDVKVLVVASDKALTDYRYKVASGQGELKRGQLLKLNNGKLEKIATGDEPHSILVNDVDATSADAECAYYVKGSFNESAIDYGDGSADEFREKLRALGIYTFEENR